MEASAFVISSPSGSSGSASGSSSSSSSSSSSHSGSGSAWATSGSTISHMLAVRESGETSEAVSDDYCAFNATETESSGCKKPRSCAACLRVAGCLVNSTGQCVSASLHYNESLDFRAAALFENTSLTMRSSVDFWNQSSNASAVAQSWIFPSMAVDYCADNDTACEICKLSVFSAVRDAPDMRYCVGANNCVCTALCDSPQFGEARENATVCDPSKAPRKPLPQAAVWIIGSAVALVFCSVLFWWVWRRTSEHHGEQDDDDPDRCLAGKDPRSAKSYAPGAMSVPSLHQAPQLDTPILELSVHESPRFSIDTSRRRGGSPVQRFE